MTKLLGSSVRGTGDDHFDVFECNNVVFALDFERLHAQAEADEAMGAVDDHADVAVWAHEYAARLASGKRPQYG